MTVFRNRRHAGRVLAERLEKFRRHPRALVLALPRGGVPVAYEIAQHLELPWDVFVVRKLGVPGHEELAMGAIASGGVIVTNPSVIERLELSARDLTAVAERELIELKRREREYTHDRPKLEPRGRLIILVDDGLATGSTMQAAVAALKRLEVEAIVVAVPVAAPEVCAAFAEEVDEIVCAERPARFYSVGTWYENFQQVTDQEVHELLRGPPKVNARA
jgi:putative phosphoribosyl transferase